MISPNFISKLSPFTPCVAKRHHGISPENAHSTPNIFSCPQSESPIDTWMSIGLFLIRSKFIADAISSEILLHHLQHTDVLIGLSGFAAVAELCF